MNNRSQKLNSSDIFAVYRLPGEQDYVFIRQKRADTKMSLEDMLNNSGFIFYPFQETKVYPPLFVHADEVFKNHLFEFDLARATNFHSTTKKAYLEIANQFIVQTAGKLKKLVLSRIEVLPNKGARIGQIFENLCDKYPDAFVYLFNHPICGTWMGASPEVFLKKEANLFTTMSLAGTRFKDQEGKITIPWTTKEYEEQEIVTLFIANALNEKGIEFQMTGPVEHNAGNLVHLKSTFEFNLPEDMVVEMIQNLHPTPAVCGVPKKEALDYIIKSEAHDRAYYTGFTGPVNLENNTSLYVNLRCVTLGNNQFVLYLGGGITSSSNSEAEWQETEAKAETMKAVLLNK